MANDCNNRLQIQCDDNHMLEKIHELFYTVENGKMHYSMMRLIPIPAKKYDSEGNPLIGFFTPMGYWGTRSNFVNMKVKPMNDELVFEYWTANGPNNYWIYALIDSIIEMMKEYSGNTKPKIFIKHLWDVCQLMTAAYMYWEPGMDVFYEYDTEEKPNEKVMNECKAVEEEKIMEMELFEFQIEDYLEYEKFEDDFEYRFRRYGWDMFYIN